MPAAMKPRILSLLVLPLAFGCVSPCYEGGYSVPSLWLDARSGDADAYLPNGVYEILIETRDDAGSCGFEVTTRGAGDGLVGEVLDATCDALSAATMDLGDPVPVRGVGFLMPWVDPSDDVVDVTVYLDGDVVAEESPTLTWHDEIGDIPYDVRSCRAVWNETVPLIELEVDESLIEPKHP